MHKKIKISILVFSVLATPIRIKNLTKKLGVFIDEVGLFGSCFPKGFSSKNSMLVMMVIHCLVYHQMRNAINEKPAKTWGLRGGLSLLCFCLVELHLRDDWTRSVTASSETAVYEIFDAFF